MRADLWAGLLIAVAGAILFAMTFNFAVTEEGLVGPRFAPRVIAALLVMGGLGLAVAAQPGRHRHADSSAPRASAEEEGSAAVLPTVLALVVIGFAYAFAIRRVGYDISTFAAAAAVLTVFGVRDVLRVTAIAAGLTLTMHVLFLEVMGIFMPNGSWVDLSRLWS